MKKNAIVLGAMALFSINGFAQMNSLRHSAGIADAWTLKTVKLSTGVALNYAEQGQKGSTPVLFIHGYSDSWRSFEQVLPHLPSGLHALAVTLRGHGDSDKPTGEYSPAVFAADLAAFVRELKTGPVIIVGHSLGGTIAQQFAISYPSLCKGLVLVATFSTFRDKPVVQEMGLIIDQLSDPVDSNFIYEFQKSTLAKEISSDEMNAYVSESRKLPARVWKSILGGLLNTDLNAGLKKIDIPTLLIWGDKDAVTPESDQEDLLARIRNAKLIIYQNTGHAVHWEEPERFTNDIVNFINKII